MNTLIDAAFSRARVVILSLVMILAVGAYAYVGIPKESSPEIPIPTLYVSTSLEGISPEDSERLLVEPLETELSAITGLKQITSNGAEGHASVQLEFEPGFDSDEALDKVREGVDRAKSDLPEDATDPVVTEINTALFPILTAILSGPVPERTLNSISEELKDAIEGLSGVLEVDVGGERTELLEVLIDPTVFETYNISFEELISQINRNNRLIAAGAIESGAGRLVLKVPGLIENVEDVMSLPIKVRGDTVVTFADVATIRRTFKDPTGFARIDGQPALALEIKKRSGANIIETVAAVRELIDEMRAEWPDSITVKYTQDESEQVQDMLSDLEANVIAAVILVMIVIVWALGVRSALLVGLAIPGAFLAGVTALWVMGYTMNLVVLFSLILVVGMLVDGAIVTTELADRRLQEGHSPRAAYAHAAKRMAWPIIASTATTLSVFFPLLFWTGTVGEFMKFLPITVILTLTASLFMALVFIPVVGGIIGKRPPQSAKDKATLHAAEQGDPRDLKGFTGGYVKLLQFAILRPWMTLILAISMLMGGFTAYAQFGNGITFFPDVEPDFAQVQVRARDNFSIYEQDALVRQVEQRLFAYDEIASVYARTGSSNRDSADLIGTIQVEFTEWDERRPAAIIGEEIRTEMAAIPGIDVQVQTASNGPSAGKPVNLRIEAHDPQVQQQVVDQIREKMADIGGFTDVTDSRPLPGVEWRIAVNRSEAARFGADISTLGQAVQLLTRGITVADYRPDDAEGSIDINVRFPSDERTLEELQSLRVPTSAGLVPISNFVTFEPSPRTGTITRVDQERVVTIEANVAPGVLVNDQTVALRSAIDAMDLPPGVEASFAGEAEDQQESMIFLVGAFVTAIFLMFVILVIQFNSFYQAFVVMSAIVFSIAGVLFGLLITGRPFGVVMGGIGVIALAGIVVNNNIVLIDTYNDLKKLGLSPLEAALRTGAQRLRPVVLTSVTTALGLMPMVIGLNINFFTREIVYGAPSTQWWTELSSAIAGGLVVATVLTLVVTPAMLMLGEKKAKRAEPTPPEPEPVAV
ncbi:MULTISPECIES: efflux RND transporter permease subunit [unclassified Sulfitobacter]|uniref:efflux RND transporter permease subunit n=1 Tax=unclassified Sulfitobacter TaxID=196795 RepID=UPI0023E0B7CF|nr:MULTISPECIES: efflux RND transporter permease subunit [unclassified Sulfitobacter]MDF3381902.1 efflux RND transporter permease subunit [Sulfitobacter sp. Ks11]MDF3385321.1 efflux RND transporter permease subunit [Sulfitobacter sp. M85]MDF3388740.1 efflux RND transporter permease subunit [Sulfitobacter sp. Ks16]MDF3399377.1 efflux RND transporter permease subunit [Sulfitobacter sp. KE39]MDF3402798.1 efflux RND transporter permease subunit [Sulfitobacter sp. Ks35]